MTKDADLMATVIIRHFINLNDKIDEKNVSIKKLNTLSRLARAYSALKQPGLTLEQAIDDKSYRFGLMVDE